MAQVGAGTRAGTWDVPRPRGIAWPSRATLGDARKTLQRWLASDVAAGRLLPWIPVAFGSGIVLYFTADREPALASSVAALARFFMARRGAIKQTGLHPNLHPNHGFSSIQG